MVLAGMTVAVAYLAIYVPLGDRIVVASRALKAAQMRERAAEETDLLGSQVERIQPRLGPKPEANETIGYVLDGIRRLPVKLVELDSGGTLDVGPYEALILRIEVSGAMQHLDALLAWIETNQRLFRVDSMHLEPPREQEHAPVLRLKLLALKVKS
jgi:hypothetical protein